MGVFYIVFEILLKRGGPNFVGFLLCGVVPWLWFSKSTNNSCRSIFQGRGLISQTYIPKIFFPLVVVGQDGFKQAFVFSLLFIFLTIYGFQVSVAWIWLPAVIVTQLLLIVAVSFFVSFIVPFAHDLQFLIRSVLTLGMFASGIFYSYESVLIPEHRDIFLLNPMANLIVNYRLVLLEGTAPKGWALFSISVFSLLIIVLMSWLMKRYDNKLTRLVIE
jgi:lipopolysaccharide transport system permease protein